MILGKEGAGGHFTVCISPTFSLPLSRPATGELFCSGRRAFELSLLFSHTGADSGPLSHPFESGHFWAGGRAGQASLTHGGVGQAVVVTGIQAFDWLGDASYGAAGRWRQEKEKAGHLAFGGRAGMAPPPHGPEEAGGPSGEGRRAGGALSPLILLRKKAPCILISLHGRRIRRAWWWQWWAGQAGQANSTGAADCW